MKYVGIDIGLKGAIVIQDNGNITCLKMPVIKNVLNVNELRNIFETFDNDTVIVYEDLGVIFGSSKATAFSMGYQCGIIESFCVCNGLKYFKIKAKEWQKEMFKGVPEITLPIKKDSLKGKRDTKAMALVAANRMFPKVPLMVGKETKPNDGIVDALLISEFAKRLNL